MADVYDELAAHLDNLPAGFPSTESGVELRILKRLFTPDEAKTALGLNMIPEPVSDIAKRMERDEEELSDIKKSEYIGESRPGCSHQFLR